MQPRRSVLRCTPSQMAQSGGPPRRANSVAIGAKRTCGEALLRVEVTRMTHLGHEWLLFAATHGTDLLYLVRDPWPWGTPHEAARFRHSARRYGGNLAAQRARAAGGDAGGRLA